MELPFQWRREHNYDVRFSKWQINGLIKDNAQNPRTICYKDKWKLPTMMINKRKLTLDRPVTYQIKVPGELDQRWSDWYGGMTITVGRGDNGLPVSTLTSIVDQAGLQSLLRRLYSLGLPLISVIYIELN